MPRVRLNPDRADLASLRPKEVCKDRKHLRTRILVRLKQLAYLNAYIRPDVKVSVAAAVLSEERVNHREVR